MSLSKKDDEETQFRVGDSVQTAYFEGEGVCWIEIEGRKRDIFSNKFELDGIVFEEPSLNLFSFNNPYGACRNCEGYGKVLGLDPSLGDILFEPDEIPVIRGGWIDRSNNLYNDDIDNKGLKSVNIFKNGTVDIKNKP
jgi:excinuclease ABC subunit A